MKEKTYIAIEGFNGCGKTTIINKLKASKILSDDTLFIKQPQDYTKKNIRRFCVDEAANQLCMLGHGRDYILSLPTNMHIISDRDVYISSVHYFPDVMGVSKSYLEKIAHEFLHRQKADRFFVLYIILTTKKNRRGVPETKPMYNYFKEYPYRLNSNEYRYFDGDRDINSVYEDVSRCIDSYRKYITKVLEDRWKRLDVF